MQNTLYQKHTFCMFLAKFGQNSGNYESIIKKVNYCFFFVVMYQTLKCMQSHLYGEIKPFARKLAYECFFSMLGTNKIKPKEVNLYGNPKQYYWKRVFSVFYVENAKKNANQQKWRNRITLPKRYNLSVF